jgi:hypothetical protein
MALINVLTYIQRALSKVDAENVSTLDGTVESTQVLGFLQVAYNELIGDFPWHHLREFQKLQVTATAHIMKLPTDTMGFDYVRYNKKDILFKEPHDMQSLLDTRDIELTSVDNNGAINDRDPAFWTTVDDENIIFDSYNVSLQSNLSLIEVVREPAELTLPTDFPDIPKRMEPTLLNMLFAESLRILKADESRAAVYDAKAFRGLAKLKRWAKRHNRNNSWFGRTYGRKTFGTIRRDIRRVIEGE